MANLQSAYGLDQPLWAQYSRYLGALAHGDFGPVLQVQGFQRHRTDRPGLAGHAGARGDCARPCPGAGDSHRHLGRAAPQLARRTMSRWRSPSRASPSLRSWCCRCSALFFGIHLHWLPVAGWEPGSIRYLVLPVIALALPPLAYIARLTRGSMLEVLRSHYIRTAIAKGLPLRIVILRHALRPALVPVAGYLAPAVASIMTGSLVVETIAGLPGVGRYLVQGALNRDYTLVMGMVILYSTRADRHGTHRRSAVRLARSAHQVRAVSGALWRERVRRLRANPGAVVALGIIGLLVATALVGPWFSPNDIETLDWSHVAARPGMAHAHWFGTDRLGRDLFVRTLEGARVSLAVGLVASAVSLSLGLCYGAIAGYVGGRTDQLMMRHDRDLKRLAADLLRHIPDRHLRPQRIPAVFRDRRGRLADHGAHRARPDAERSPAGVHRGRGGVRCEHRAHHLQARRAQRDRSGDRVRARSRCRRSFCSRAS